MCTCVAGISPGFDPDRVLLRCVFFIGSDKSKYVSVGFYTSRNYEALVELGGSEKSPIILTVQHVRTLAENLSRQ